MDSNSLAEVGPVCLVVTGMPGSGKSTVAELIANSLPRAARVSGDTVAGMILGGRVWALGEPREEASAQVELTNRNLATLANNMTEAGFTAVIETVITNRSELDLITASLTCESLLIVLAPGIEVCRSRNADRTEDERWTFDGYEALEADMLQSFQEIAWWFDTAHLTPDQTAEQIIRAAHVRI